MKCDLCGLEMFIDNRVSDGKTKTIYYNCKNKNCQAARKVNRNMKFFCCEKSLVQISSGKFAIASRAEDYYEQIEDKLYITCPICNNEHLFDVCGKTEDSIRF